MKRCNRCKTWKERSDFSKNARKYDGLQSYCKECCIAIDKRRQVGIYRGPCIDGAGLFAMPFRRDRLYTEPTGRVIATRSVRGENGPT